MRQRATWILLGVFLSAIGLLWWTELAKVPTRAEKRRVVDRVLPGLIDLRRSEVDRLEIDHPSASQTIVFAKRDDGGWQIRKPIDVSAKREGVESLIKTLVEMRRSEDSGTIDDSANTFQLDRPTATVRLYVKGRPAPIATLDVGKTVRDLTAVRTSDSVGIDLVPSLGLTSLNLPLIDWRDPTLMEFPSFQLEKVRIADRDPPQTVELQRDERKWRLRAPMAARADADKVETLIAELGALEVAGGHDGFVADDVKAADRSKYGLNPPRLTIEVAPFPNTGTRPERIEIGDAVEGEKNLAYAVRGGQDDVVKVDLKRFRDAYAGPSALRSPEVFDFQSPKVAKLRIERPSRTFELERIEGVWRQRLPFNEAVDAAAVQALLESLEKTKATAFLDPSAVLEPKLDGRSIRIQIWDDPKSAGPKVDLKLGRHDPLRKTVYGRFEGEPTILALQDSLLKELPSGLLAFRSRTIAPFAPAAVSKFTVTADQKHVTVVSPGSKQTSVHWRMTEPVAGPTDETSITKILTHLAGLKAETWESESDGDLARYGLDKPTLAIDWELSEKARTGGLRIGRRKEGSANSYASLVGLPGVFTVAPITLEYLSMELRDRSVLKFNPSEVRRVVLEWRGRRLALESRGEYVSKTRWRVLEPSGTPELNLDYVDHVLQTLSQLETPRFLQYDGPVAESGDLGHPLLSIGIALQAGPKTIPLSVRIGELLGETPDSAQYSAAATRERTGPTFVIQADPAFREVIRYGARSADLPVDVFAPLPR